MGERDGLVERDEYDRQRLREDQGVSHCYEPAALTVPNSSGQKGCLDGHLESELDVLRQGQFHFTAANVRQTIGAC